MIHSGDVTAEAMQTVLYPAERISPVWIAIKGNIAVEPSHHINSRFQITQASFKTNKGTPPGVPLLLSD